MKLLMHMCCAPCTTYPLSVLRQEGIEPTGLYFNPNIHPIEEFERRKKTVEEFAALKSLDVKIYDDFRQSDWENFEGPADDRCIMCYSVRLKRAAELAASGGFEAFTTSLLVSPYQKHDLIKELGEGFASEYGIGFYYKDFRPGFREGQREAKEMGLYRQKYCGCIISLRNP
ncbi:MAG: epoxyqueuosine reductase QueH [Clostridiaceae bacterium]|jgi:predicted adenine nucleotide alpha hydrolase (AANH) superfamily ATPase|nr:epoxyqueuosine reductase QueH [Clostridiaceae bacterium]